ncbi:hypothetical protein [Rhizobium chutanense]|uniref:hypothetical protein n=1 Tax=Rhizobium chutanense TaxID=2035448 RepID=UPI001FE22F39|nr:hypothetical protein [Rhizobium chutanense]
MMKRIGGCPVCFFCSAACEVAAPIGKFKKNMASNTRKNRYFPKTEIAKRTIKSPQLYMRRQLAIAPNRSKPDFDGGYRPPHLRSDSPPIRQKRNS